MMYYKKMVASVKSNGKVLREKGDTVYIPFGSEYSLLLKNLNVTKAKVKIEIDGVNVLDSSSLILDSNETIDLERFVKDGNFDKGPRFKFIEKTEQISDYRGDRIDDGIIRISYQFEKNVSYYPTITTWPSSSTDYYYTTYGDYNPYRDVLDSVSYCSSVDNDNGITVNGSESNQQFNYGYIGELEEEEHVIVFQLKGEIGQDIVTKPLTVKTKIICDVCGKSNTSKNNFCSECGNNLKF
ncbi:MAG TPA: hypothetical protein VK982_09480 [Bacteroidales bacterium]|nr:hypothetical protein [Bacteroidales bacterium]